MRKIRGAREAQNGVVKVGKYHYIYYGFGKDNENDEVGYNWRHTFDHRPTKEEILEVILEAIDKDTKEKIIDGFFYNGDKYHLTIENQLNYAMYSKTLASKETVVVKVERDGVDTNITMSKTEFDNMYKAALAHIKNCHQSCLKEKAAIDMSQFEF